MRKDVQRYSPAARRAIVRPLPMQPEAEVWMDNRYQLLTRVRTAVKRQEVREVSGFHPVPGMPGRFAVRVLRVKPETPAWRRALPMVATTLACAAGLVAAAGLVLSWTLAALATVPVAVWVVLAVVLAVPGSRAVVVIVKVVIR